MRELIGILFVLIVGGVAVALRMGWRPWDQLGARRQLRRTTRWLEKNYPSSGGTWDGPQWIEAQEAVGGKFLLYPNNLKGDSNLADGEG
ncbi:MAG: hypothetical protein FWF25_01280 [Propionibacteriaceae bacterium]|nr:hypothetical protein [Propionibacteriaceae bacterium]